MMVCEEGFEKLYEQFVVENYIGSSGEPITREFFREVWAEMSESERTALIRRAW